jgi:hypothetical protein
MPLSRVAARAGVEKHIAEASAAKQSRVLGMWVDLWAVTCPTVAPCGGRDEVVKVTKPSTQHVRMKLTEPYRSNIRYTFNMCFKLLKLLNNISDEKIRRRMEGRIFRDFYAEISIWRTFQRDDRLPKMAVPTRTSVAPSAIARGKSLLMPIDSRGNT